MKTLKQIREDLKGVRHYYSRKNEFDTGLRLVGNNVIFDMVQKYNAAVRSAPPKLYDVYVSLYVRNLTQEALAIELGFSPEYVWVLNNKLLEHLQNHISQ